MNDKTINRTLETGGVGSSGGFWLLIFLVATVMAIAAPFLLGKPGVLITIPMAIFALLVACGFYAIQPNQAVAVILFGNYKGTDRTTGLRWVPFWYERKKVSLRVRNVTSEALKVNDKRGNPIEIAAVVVWRVEDTAQASFDVDNYEHYVKVQSESAVRYLANAYAYDHGDGEEITLRSATEVVNEALRVELQERLGKAGVKVEEARLTHLAYAPEIAQVMLRRQQAEAIVDARTKIVQGAVGMVELALDELAKKEVVDLDNERKASMVSNLLVVLCGESEVHPVVNAGTLYS